VSGVPPDRPDGPPASPWSDERPRLVLPGVFAPAAPPAPSRFTEALGPLLPLFALDVLTAFTVGMIPPVLPLMAADLGLSTVEAGLINTVYALGRLAGSYPGSWLRARHGTRATVFYGLAGLVVGAVGSALAPTLPLLLLARLVMGVASAAAFLAVFAELLESAAPAWRGRLANAFEFMAILSLAIGAVLAAAISQGAGWRGVFGFTSILTLGCFLVARRIEPEAGRRPPEGRTGTGWPSATEVIAFAPIYAASFAMATTWSGLYATLAPLLGAEHYGLSATAIGWAMSGGYLAELAGLAFVGFLIDRVRREPVFVVGAVGVALGGMLLALGARPVAFSLGLVLLGGGFSVWMIPATVLTDRVGTPLPAVHLATYRISMDGGMILGPLVLGLLGTLAGDRAAAGVGGLIMAAGAATLLPRSRPGSPPRPR
jgi:MFS family permease